MSISKKLKELIVAFGAVQNVNALRGNRIDSLIGTLAAWISEHGGGGGGDNDFVVTADFVPGASSFDLDNFSATLDEIIAAKKAGKNVRLDASIDQQGLDIVFSASLTWYIEMDEPLVIFIGAFTPPSGKAIALVSIGGDMEAVVSVHPLSESDASPLIVPGTIDDTEGTAVSTQSVPLADIAQAFADGRAVYFEAELAGARGRYPCTSVKPSGSDYIVTYAAPMAAGGAAYVAQIVFNGSDTNGTFTTGS